VVLIKHLVDRWLTSAVVIQDFEKDVIFIGRRNVSMRHIHTQFDILFELIQAQNRRRCTLLSTGGASDGPEYDSRIL